MRDLEGKLQRILHAHGLNCAAAINSAGQIVARAGDFEEFHTQGLVAALLGPYGSAKATFDYVQGQTLVPQMYRQGEEIAFLDMAGAGLAVVVFGRLEGDVLAQYALSKVVGQSIAEVFVENHV